MSVLIKGMKIPQSCYLCDMLELSGAVGCKHAYDTSNSEWGRALNCPLVEIPDHGDLIDREELKHSFCVECTLYPDNCLKEDCDWGSIYHIDHAPVAIPAERSKDATD